MAREIQVLPDLLINQIAAGEVVERPASVVKELVENALDAGASHIFVEIEGGGKTKIRILDNGIGMSAAGVEMALKRHATSKLRNIDELFGIQSFGFRGEALPSIAAVSRMTITTREREGAGSATRLQIEGGKIVERSVVGAPVGTCIEINDLLFNVPARQKFMKGEATENSHISETMNKLALANPDVHFRLKNGSRTTLNAPRHENLRDRVTAVMGSRLGQNMQYASGECGGVLVKVYLGAPGLAQSTTRALQIFAGKRPIRDRGVLSAVMQGYGEKIPSGRYPAALILIETPNADVDVNVHPQKLEVRFADPQLVYAAVRQVVRSGVEEASWQVGDDRQQHGIQMHAITSSAPPRIDRFAGSNAVGASAPASQLAVNYAREHAKRMLPGGRVSQPAVKAGEHNPLVESHTSKAGEEASPQRVVASGSGANSPDKVQPEAVLSETMLSETMLSETMPTGQSDLVSAKAPLPGPDSKAEELGSVAPVVADSAGAGFFSSLRYLGQLDRTYLLCEANSELVMIDQHAAHERVELSKLIAQYHEETISIQRMLFPQRVELTFEQAKAADAHGSELAAMGFELDDFGDGGGTLSYALKAVPAGLRESEPVKVLIELLDELVKIGSSRALDSKVEAMLATLACHSVVRAGDTLRPQEVQSLLRSMDAVDFSGAATHGRPVLLRIGVDEIGRRFGR
ncbi:MAG: DNA mismatch repair endonuclease MutL [Kofleriaceae bacterium]|nr:DNA mismatch repair endonuclease MutL [Kofleriaceae bacterium]